MVSRGASSGGRPWPLPSWGVCVRACVRLCVCSPVVFLLRPWPDVCGVFTHGSWHVLTCVRCVIVCVNVLERSDPVDRWKKNHPPVLPFSVCLSVHYYPSFLFLSQSPLSLSFSFLSLSLPFLSLSLYFLSLSPSLHYHCSTIRPARDRECSCLGVLQRGWGGEWRGGLLFLAPTGTNNNSFTWDTNCPLRLANVISKNPTSFPVSLPLCIYVPFIPRPPPPPSQLSIISHDRWALRHCQNSPAPKILIPVFAPPSSLSSSSFPSLLPIMHALLCPLKVWGRGRGSATPAQLPAILLFWGGSCLIFLSVVFILALSIVTDPTPAPPLCLVAVHTAGPQHPWKGQREKESADSVGSLVIFLLFFFPLRTPSFFYLCGFNFSSAGMTWKAPSWKSSVWSAFFFHSSADPPSASGSAAKSIFPCV